jgi:ubiquinol-cytochrome c reductase cytochrome c1 subunit
MGPGFRRDDGAFGWQLANMGTMKMLKALGIAAVAVLASAGIAAAQIEEQRPAKDISYSFEGPFGTYDKGQLQRGYKVYKDVCSNCHSLRLIHFRNLSEPGALGFSEEEVKALAATVKVQDGPDEAGNMFERPGLPSDAFPWIFANEQQARAANGGALPPDLSLITKARAGWYGTITQFLHGIGGPEYVYSVLTGYEPTPAELAKEQPEGKFYNPYFAGSHWIGMPPNGTLTDGMVTFDDGAPNKIDDMARDVSAFLAWAAEPKMEERKGAGFTVVIYLAVMAVLMFLVKQKVWAKVEH